MRYASVVDFLPAIWHIEGELGQTALLCSLLGDAQIVSSMLTKKEEVYLPLNWYFDNKEEKCGETPAQVHCNSLRL